MVSILTDVESNRSSFEHDVAVKPVCVLQRTHRSDNLCQCDDWVFMCGLETILLQPHHGMSEADEKRNSTTYERMKKAKESYTGNDDETSCSVRDSSVERDYGSYGGRVLGYLSLGRP